MPRYKLTLEYDGTRYSGWQVQNNARSVQGSLILAGTDAFGRIGQVMGSGRTDSGVHALAQVAHIDLEKKLPADKIVSSLNYYLPADVNVLSAAMVDNRFHARHDATGRSYLYQISTRRSAFVKPYVWWVRDTLNLGLMRRAALAAAGLHDYASFADRDDEDKSTLVNVQSLDIATAGDLILIRIRASHFLRKMVRRVVGTLVEIGTSRESPDLFAQALESPRDFELAFTSPPSGLFLEQVIYKGESFSADLKPAIPIPTPR